MSYLVQRSMSIAEGRPRRLNRCLPARFRDVTPQLLPFVPLTLPPPMSPSPEPQTLPASGRPSPPSPEHSTSAPSLLSRLGRMLQQPQRNIFGLLRKYDTGTLPVHDPEELITLESVFDTHEPESANNSAEPSNLTIHDPYPNKNSFLVGEWYHAGTQKSRESFRDLLDIIGSLAFKPEDVRETPWDKIDEHLGRNDFDAVVPDDHNPDWLDEDASWKKTPIRISVPFHSHAKTPGLKDFLAGDLYHRPIVSIICEKIKNLNHDKQFHYEPYELFWQTSDNGPRTRVYSELYKSPAFIDAHCELQDAPGEPDCDLPRVIVGLMFASDATQLTSFGNAKLWPCYMYFGNESKYRRCKPSCHLCEHVAYFQEVCSHTLSGFLLFDTPAAAGFLQGFRHRALGVKRRSSETHDPLLS